MGTACPEGRYWRDRSHGCGQYSHRPYRTRWGRWSYRTYGLDRSGLYRNRSHGCSGGHWTYGSSLDSHGADWCSRGHRAHWCRVYRDRADGTHGSGKHSDWTDRSYGRSKHRNRANGLYRVDWSRLNCNRAYGLDWRC